MFQITHIIETSDVCSLSFLIMLLTLVGQPFVARSPELHNLGVRIAAGVGLVYAGLTILERDLGTAGEIAALVLRSLAAGGVVLGPTWIVLSVGAYVRDQHRRMSAAAEARAAARRRERERRKQDAEEKERRRRADREWERTRPERERATREAADQAARRAQIEAERKHQEALRQTDEQRRREEVRYKCRLLYDRYAKELKTSMSQKRFDEYFATYLSDRYSAEEVERRGRELQAMLLDTVRPASPTRQRRTLSEIQEEFTRRRNEVQTTSLDEDAKAALVADLNREEDKAIRGALQQ